jgi:excisionase family DNA binding protein
MSKLAAPSRSASKAEAQQARRALEALREGRPLVGDSAAPAAATAGFERLLEAMAAGGGAAVVALDAELTIHEAATLLGVPRAVLVSRMRDGTLPFQAVEDGRRISVADVVAYLERARGDQGRALDELVQTNQGAALYD